jgi:hypothetical protein
MLYIDNPSILQNNKIFVPLVIIISIIISLNINRSKIFEFFTPITNKKIK